MRIVISPEQLETCSQRVRQASARIHDLSGRLHQILNSADWETRQTVNVEGFVGAATVNANALVDFADGMARFLAHKAALFHEVDNSGAGALSALGQQLLAGPAPRPDGTVLQKAREAAERFLSAGGFLKRPGESSGWSLTKLFKVGWQAVQDGWKAIHGDRIVDVINIAGGFFSMYEGGVTVMAGAAMVWTAPVTGPVGVLAGMAIMLVGGLMVAHGVEDVIEGGSSLYTGGESKCEPIRNVYRSLANKVGLSDKAGAAAYDVVGFGLSIVNPARFAKHAATKVTGRAAKEAALKSARLAESHVVKEAVELAEKRALRKFREPSDFLNKFGRRVQPNITRDIEMKRAQFIQRLKEASRPAAEKAYATEYAKVIAQKTFPPSRYTWKFVEDLQKTKSYKVFEKIDKGTDLTQTVDSINKAIDENRKGSSGSSPPAGPST